MITKEEILARSEKLGVMDIRFGKRKQTLKDYEQALDALEERQEVVTDEILERAREVGPEGIEY